jgi:ADP-ribose pyrophosphatase YjhB (NUDIX family)
MLSKEELIEYCGDARQNYLPHISIDCVVFGFHEGVMKVLLLQTKKPDEYYLPGGFLFRDEPTDEAANRILKKRTGLDDIFLQQFHVFGDPERARQHVDMYKDMIPASENWFAMRFLTIGYYALVDFVNVSPSPDQFAESCVWCDLHDLPQLMIDHSAILQKALDTLRLHLNYEPIGYNLMPKEFTMPELQKLYEAILDKKLDRRNFQRRMLGFGIMNKSEKLRKGGAHKAPFLYSFDLDKYTAALTEGVKGGW